MVEEHIYKTVEITGTSHESPAEAVKNAVAKAAETLRHIDWFEVVNVRGNVTEGRVDYFQVTVKIGFRLE